MLSRPHPCLSWLSVNPADTRRLYDRLYSFRDAELEKDPTFSGMPQSLIDWTWHSWLPTSLHRYEKQVRDHIHYLDLKLGRLKEHLEQVAGGVLDDHDAAADLWDRLQRQLPANKVEI